jgi:hypothetical protein
MVVVRVQFCSLMVVSNDGDVCLVFDLRSLFPPMSLIDSAGGL